MFGMKFRDRELPAPPLENNSQSSSTKKTSMETTRKSLLETTTSKTSLKTVKMMEVASPQMSPHLLRSNGRLPSCLEVRFDHFKPSKYWFSLCRCLGSPGTNQWTGKQLKRWSRKVSDLILKQRGESDPISIETLTFYSLAVGENGCFLVRDSRHGGVDSPLTLTLFNNDKVFNISIRLRPDSKVGQDAFCGGFKFSTQTIPGCSWQGET